ncbi:uncharacterized protein B0I36DRAFT_249094 [Microdochium trichocladiopsis]|uniref:ATP-dependent RNA helicase DHX8 n=1 Tax=Microdochium trichocladiopsis TaxID=1682393 RepID=A0A9P8Y227_9PEZI|nr:uncharacterized protein B0I36DRAFT_249094 [Microdochium trichocladiopsis]KAH7026626.1 hypothetical protein B0I36DRAFT_249094 [Microdochium trichocladiopsis]
MAPTKPFRQIRAACRPAKTNHTTESPASGSDDNDDLITIYQAYNAAIATAACAAQRLDASPLFKLTRMTWIKPSWCWMMYRAGYSYKDANQARILALRMRKGDLWTLLRMAELTTHAPRSPPGTSAPSADKPKSEKVKVQWDPERDARLEKLDYRSIQIGIPAGVAARWISEWIVDITDVTDTARELKQVLDGEPGIMDEELAERGLYPVEEEIVVPDDLRVILRMDSS